MRARFRLVEEPLGPDALERPTQEEVAQAWAAALKLPVPDYPAQLRRFLFPLNRPPGQR